jgi:hypothetical protein
MFVGLIALIILLAALPSSVTESVTERVSSGTTSSRGDVSAGRVEYIWKPLLPTILDSPVFGHGLNSVYWSEPARSGAMLPVGHPHSAYLQVLLDFGLGGAVIIAIFYMKLWRLFKVLQEKHPEPLWRGFFEGGAACILVLLVQGVTDDKFIPTFPQTNLWLAAGAAIGWASRLNIPIGRKSKKSTSLQRAKSHPVVEGVQSYAPWESRSPRSCRTYLVRQLG